MLTTRMSEAKAAVQDNLNSPEAEQVREGYNNIKSGAASMAKHVRDDSVAIASKAAHDIKEEASEKYAYLKDQSRVQADRLEAYVHAKPMQSIAIAAGVGALLALIARR